MQQYAGPFCLNGFDGLVTREVLAKANDTLGQADLSESLVALILGNVLGRSTGWCTFASTALLAVCVDGRVVNNLIVKSLVCVA